MNENVRPTLREPKFVAPLKRHALHRCFGEANALREPKFVAPLKLTVVSTGAA